MSDPIPTPFLHVHVETIDPIFVGLDGYLAGVPVCRVVFRREKSKRCKTFLVRDLVAAIKRRLGQSAPRWFFIDGDEGAIPSYFASYVNANLRMKVYTEFVGDKPMLDRESSIILTDHTAVRPKSLAKPFSTGLLFNSVVAPASSTKQERATFVTQLRKDENTGVILYLRAAARRKQAIDQIKSIIGTPWTLTSTATSARLPVAPV